MAKSESVEGRILEWARDKGIFEGSSPDIQMTKLFDEAAELEDEIESGERV